ncbi:hypothetical protein [Pectobacterium polaris]|uniref:hypothetical protein n=1 Tax=Pectobacterium polaris TaxID=2042057 RepID=UPI0032E413F5
MTISTAGMIAAVREAAHMTKTQEERDVLNGIANRVEMLAEANSIKSLELDSIRQALKIPGSDSVQAGTIAAFCKLQSDLQEATALANRLRRTAKEHQEENQLLRTELAVSQPCNVPDAIDAAVDEILAIDTVASTAAIKSLFHQYTGKMRLDAAAQALPVVPDEITFEQACLEVKGLSPAEAYMKAWIARAAMVQSGNPVWSGIDWAKGCKPTPALEGWALVPVTADSEMMAAAIACGVTRGTDGALYVKYDDIYAAMIAAAPQLRKDGDA